MADIDCRDTGERRDGLSLDDRSAIELFTPRFGKNQMWFRTASRLHVGSARDSSRSDEISSNLVTQGTNKVESVKICDWR